LKIYLGSLYEENKEYEKAIETYQTVLGRGAAQKPREESSDAIEKTDYDIHLRLGSIYYYKLKKEQEALEQAALARRIDLQRPESYLFQGLVLYDAKRYEEATAVFIQGIEKNPKSPDLHFHLGAAYDKLNRFNDLIKEMEQAITLDAKHANALNYLGYTYAEKGVRINEAIDLINRALSVRPNDGYFIDSLGWAYYKKGMIRDAMVNLKRAVSLVPDDPVIREHLGEVYLQDKLADLAREEWMHSLRLDPKNEKLLTRFKEAGFGEPILEESSQRRNDIPQNPQTETSNQKEIPVESVH
ncbi:MAG TPA: tetratricopeptide repeat protein, partial [Candidatus Manganitrophaceae bacterium]